MTRAGSRHAVTAAGGDGTGDAARSVAGVLAVRIALAVPVLLVALAGAVVLYRESISVHVFGPFIEGDAPSRIRLYSTPWLVGAAGCLLLAGLVVVFAVRDVVRRRRVQRSLRAR